MTGTVCGPLNNMREINVLAELNRVIGKQQQGDGRWSSGDGIVVLSSSFTSLHHANWISGTGSSWTILTSRPGIMQTGSLGRDILGQFSVYGLAPCKLDLHNSHFTSQQHANWISVAASSWTIFASRPDIMQSVLSDGIFLDNSHFASRHHADGISVTGSSWTIFYSACCCVEMQAADRIAVSLCHCILAPGRPVLTVTLSRKACGGVGFRVPIVQ